MGNNTEVFMFDWSDVVDVLIKGGCNNRQVVEKVLHMYGTKISNVYVVMYDDGMGDSDSFWRLYHVLEDLFGVEECGELMFNANYTYLTGYKGSFEDEEKEVQKLREVVEGE